MAGRKGGGAENRHVFQRLAFFAYCALMLWLLFGQRFETEHAGSYSQALDSNLNLIPLATIRLYIKLLSGGYSHALMRHAFINLAGNVLMFVPLGVLLPGIWQKMRKFFRFLLSVTGMILAVELVQLFTLLGSCDVDDLLLNLLGAVLGFCAWKLLFGRRK